MNRHTNALQSVGSAFKGLMHGAGSRNFRLHLLAGAAALFLAYYLPLTSPERATIIILVALVLTAELMNTAIEELADALTQEHHPGIAKTKELAAAAVLVLSIAAAVVGLPIFISYMI